MTPTLRKAIAALEIIGGLAGIYLIVRSSFGSSESSGQGALAIAVAITFVTLYLTSILAGWMLWQSRASGRRLSLFTQALQLPWFQLFGLKYTFAAGAYAVAGFESGRADFQVALGSQCRFEILSEPAGSALYVNLVPLVLFVALSLAGKDSSGS